MERKKDVFIVMPVYNEEESVEKVVEEWIPALEKIGINYTLCILNDGSTDNTLSILRGYEKKYPQIEIIDKKNSGHGQTCIQGYKLAISRGAEWVFQIDSDGQCDPKFFSDIWKWKDKCSAIFGWRKTRADGMKRVFISKFVRVFTFAATFSNIKDGNVPYRLIHRDIMKKIVDKVPSDFHLANIYISVLANNQEKIKWVPIHFRDRTGGSPSVKTFSFVKHGIKLFKQLRNAKYQK